MDMHEAINHANKPAPLVPLLGGIHRRSTHDRVSLPIPDHPHIWQGYFLAGQFGMLHGDGGLYKSALAAKLACEHTNPDGGWLLGRPVMPGRCVYIDAENDDNVIDDRLRRLGLQADNDRLEYHTVDGGLLGRAQQAGVLVDLIGELVTPNQATLLVIDGLASAWGLREDEQHVVQSFLDDVNRARREYGCAVLLIHHDQRSGGDYRGFGNLHNSIRLRFHLKPTHERDEDAPTNEITLHHKKQSQGPRLPRLPFVVDWQEHRITFTPDKADAAKVEQVVRYVQMAGGNVVDNRELAKRFDLSRNFFNRNSGVLHAAGIERENEVNPYNSRGWRSAS